MSGKKIELDTIHAADQIEKEIREACVFLREKNNTVPSQTIQFILDAALERLKLPAIVKLSDRVHDEDLEKLGIIADKSTFHPVRYWCNASQEHINLNNKINYKFVVTKLFKRGISQGIEEGKAIRSQEIKDLLNNKE